LSEIWRKIRKLRRKSKSFFAILLSTILSVSSIPKINAQAAESNDWSAHVGESTTFDFTGDYQTFEVPYTGKYFLEAWGAQGGGVLAGGGYSYGYATLYKGDTIYISVGGLGIVTEQNSSSLVKGSGGWNGGGDAMGGAGGGGGATSITTTLRGEEGTEGLLENYKDYTDEILMVAGGSGGKGSKMVSNSNAICYSSDGTFMNYVGGAQMTATEQIRQTGNGGGGVNDWVTSGNHTGEGNVLRSNIKTSTLFGKGEDGENESYVDGYPGAGGGGYKAGVINRGTGDRFVSTQSTGVLGGSGGTGYVNDYLLADAATIWEADVYENTGNGKAKITFEGYSLSTLTIDTNGIGTVEVNDENVTVEQNGNLYVITGVVGETMDFPELVLNEGETLIGYKQKTGSLEADDENGNIFTIPESYTFGTKNTILVANFSSNMNIIIKKQDDSDTDFDLTINQVDDSAKYFKVLTSDDNGETWKAVLTQNDVEGNDISVEQKYSFLNLGSTNTWTTSTTQSFTAPADGYYYLEATGASAQCLDVSEIYFPIAGGFSSGYRYLSKGQTIYVAVGGRGYGYHKNPLKYGPGGYNGGGLGRDHSNRCVTGGGGATSWTITNRGVLSSYNSYRGEVILVAGGSGGIENGVSCSRGTTTSWLIKNAQTPSNITGLGGGLNGGTTTNNGVGGSQSAAGTGGSFGQGANTPTSTSSKSYDCGGGGGGWYGGGYATVDDDSGGGGSGYIGGVFNATTLQGEASKSSVASTLDGTAYVRLDERVYTNNVVSDIHLYDYEAPNAPSDIEQSEESDGKVEISWSNNGDNGTKSLYKVESYSAANISDSTIDPFNETNLIETSDIMTYDYTSGVKGFYYYMDSKSEGEIYDEETDSLNDSVDTDDIVTLSDDESGASLEIDQPTKTTYLHVAAVDNVGNVSETVIYLIYLASYDITVDPNGGVWNDSDSASVITLKEGESMEVENPTRDGYTFQDWTLSGEDSSLEDTTFTMGSENVTLTANWVANTDTPYTVNHYKQNNNGSYPDTPSETESLTGTTDTEVTPDVHTYFGYISPEAQTKIIAGDGKMTVDYYYQKLSRDISGTIKWEDKNNEYDSRPDTVTISLVDSSAVVKTIEISTEDNVGSFVFEDVPRYDDDGNEIIYTVIEGDVISKNAPEDKYISNTEGDISSGFVITNTLQNNVSEEEPKEPDEPDNEEIEETGFTIKGSITWEDNNNNLGYRPENVIINLYMDGELLKTITKDKDVASYIFTNLERYIYNADGTVKETHTYQIEEVINPVPSYIVNGTVKEAYTITYSLPKIDTKDGTGIINITNTFNNADNIISVKPYNNSLTIKTNKDIYTEIVLRKMDSSYVDNEVVYKDTYSDVYYNLEVSNIAETISHMISGKYEVDIISSSFSIDSVVLTDSEYVSLIKENGKYYIIIEETDNDSYGMISINLSEKEHIGYQTGADKSDDSNYQANNFWKANIEKTSETKAKVKMSRKLVAPSVAETEVSESETRETTELKTEETLEETSETNETVLDTSENTLEESSSSVFEMN
jgi:uncharacterized repeat protein (TIGR02543 family)